MIFRRNYLTELPDDIMRLIYKKLYDISVKAIKKDDLTENIEIYYELQDRMNWGKCGGKIDYNFPYRQITERRTSTRHKYFYDEIEKNVYDLKYSKINSEQIDIMINADKYNNKETAHAKRIDIALTLTRKMLIIPHKIRFVRVRSDELLKMYNLNYHLYKELKEYIKIDNTYKNFSYYLDKGDFVIVFKKSRCCLGDLFLNFVNEIYWVIFEGRLEIFKEWKYQELQAKREIDPTECDGLALDFRFLRYLERELSIDEFLNNCFIDLQGETATLIKGRQLTILNTEEDFYQGDSDDEEYDEEPDEDD